MVLYPPATRPWVYCPLCGVRLTREPIDVPFPGHESWCTPWSRMANRLLGALAEDDIYSRTLFHRWGDFSERLFLGAYAEGAGSGSIRDEDLQCLRVCGATSRAELMATMTTAADGSPTAVASQAPSGDSWPRRMCDDSSSSLGDPLGMARFFKPRRRETKETSRSCSGSGGMSAEYAVRQKTSGVLPRPSCAGAPNNPYLSPARPSSLPPRSGWRARPAKLQPVPRQDLERFARRLQGWTEKHPPFRKGWTDLRGNHICGSGHIHTPENLARAWHDGHAVPRA